MRKIFSMAVSVTTIALVVLLDSCSKGLPPVRFPNPLDGGCQVAEFHSAIVDLFNNPPLPYPFRKTYGPGGRVTEIAFGTLDQFIPWDIANRLIDVNIVQKDRRVFLIRAETAKAVIHDTLYTIYLNHDGRPDSCIGGPGNDPGLSDNLAQSEYYFYKGGRLQVVSYKVTYSENGNTYAYSGTDTVYYDKYSNPVKFRYNSYTYDYTKAGGQKFYLDDFSSFEADFYLLQYLGYFPEINNPPNLRTTQWNSDAGDGRPWPLENQQFDAEGRLTSFGLIGDTYTITWNCSR